VHHPMKERLWASLAHVPIITLIWSTYVMYCYYQGNWCALAAINKMLTKPSIPITPLVFTALSIPVALTIMFLKKRSRLIHNNAREAYLFNIWLIKVYAGILLVAAVGLWLHCVAIKIAALVLGALVSLLVIQQAFCGVISAFTGKQYQYWYPLRKK